MPPIRSIKNQYRGINAHLHSRLQTEGGWDSFHTIHISHLTTALQIQLAPLGYEADIEQSLQIRRSLEPARYPVSDVTIYDPDLSRQYQPIQVSAGNMQEIVMPIPDFLGLTDTDIKTYKAIGLYQAVPDDNERGDPIAWIELVSPSNKPMGRDFETYRDKRTKVLQTGIIFVEIDYLHQYPPTFESIPDYYTSVKNRRPISGSHPYRITVIDPHPDFFEGEGRSRQFDVDEPIPNARIPLNEGQGLDFDFGNVYRRTFEEMLYGNKIDYGQLPLNFELYSPGDQARIVSRMLAVIEVARNGVNLEREPQAVEIIPLDVGLNRLECLEKLGVRNVNFEILVLNQIQFHHTPRQPSMVLDMPYFRRHALSIALLAAGIVFIAWNIPQLSFILYPFRLFVTFVHESGHSLMAVFTGGGVDSFQVFSDGTGLARTIGGNRYLILPAGYLGAAFFGAALFYLVNRVPFPRKIALGLGTIFILISLFLQANGIALVIGVLTGLALIFLGLRGSLSTNIFVLNVLAILTGLNAVLDAYSLARNSTAGLGTVMNDAAAFSMLTPGIPAVIWALIWAFLALLMVGTSVWYSVVRPIRRGE